MTYVDFAVAVFLAWAAWAIFNVMMAMVAERQVPLAGAAAYVVGFWRPQVFLSPEVSERLTIEEALGILFHEYGHVAAGHIRRNMLMVVVFPFYRRSKLCERWQEIEADLFAARFGFGTALASALRKLSADQVDVNRAELLEFLCGSCI